MTTAPLDAAALAPHVPRILAELRQHSALLRPTGGLRSVATVLQRLFDELFGDRHGERDRRRFFILVAPLLRQQVIARMSTVNISAVSRINTMEIDQWLTRLEGFDARCVQMIELHYFVGLSTRSTAEMLGVSPQAVIRDLRFAKAWLQARTRWLHRPDAPA